MRTVRLLTGGGVHPLAHCILGYTPLLAYCMLGYTPLPREQNNDWQTGVKTLPSRNFVCGR